MSNVESIVLAPPMSDAKHRFEEERLRIAIAMKRLPAAIEHVGSTAIPGIQAKPIVDILIGMRALPLEDAVGPLTKLGYEHVPGAGGADRLFFKLGTPRRFHAHVVLHDGVEWRRHIIFRDWLNLRPDLAKEYEALKIELSARFAEDRAAYAEAKTPFVERVLAEAARFPALRLQR